jgi:hypothetical protein
VYSSTLPIFFYFKKVSEAKCDEKYKTAHQATAVCLEKFKIEHYAATLCLALKKKYARKGTSS